MTRASFWNNPSAKDTHHVENDLPARHDTRSQCGHDTPTDGTQHRFQNSECCAARHAGPRSTCRTRSKHERNRPNEPQSTTAMGLLIRFSDRLNLEGAAMSNFAIFCLVIGAIFGAFLIIEPQVAKGWYIAAQAGLVICGLAFICAMLIGRRIKFDPVLR